MKTNNILLTGSTGFIGSYFQNKYKYKYKISSFSFRTDALESLDLSSISTIIHLSSLVHQVREVADEEYIRINITQTINLAKKSKNYGVKHFIFMSTISVYGIEEGIINDDSPFNPITKYGKSKLKAEQELLELEDENFKISIIRPPIVNGYNAPGNMKKLITLIDKVWILPFGEIDNKRSMIYVGNLCHLVDEIVIQEKRGIFLASDDSELSTTHLIELIFKNLTKKRYLVKVPFFENLLKKMKPEIHTRLYKSLIIDNRTTMKTLNIKNIYTIEESILLMMKGEK